MSDKHRQIPVFASYLFSPRPYQRFNNSLPNCEVEYDRHISERLYLSQMQNKIMFII